VSRKLGSEYVAVLRLSVWVEDGHDDVHVCTNIMRSLCRDEFLPSYISKIRPFHFDGTLLWFIIDHSPADG
jgi:hypothetical protein